MGCGDAGVRLRCPHDLLMPTRPRPVRPGRGYAHRLRRPAAGWLTAPAAALVFYRSRRRVPAAVHPPATTARQFLPHHRGARRHRRDVRPAGPGGSFPLRTAVGGGPHASSIQPGSRPCRVHGPHRSGAAPEPAAQSRAVDVGRAPGRGTADRLHRRVAAGLHRGPGRAPGAGPLHPGVRVPTQLSPRRPAAGRSVGRRSPATGRRPIWHDAEVTAPPPAAWGPPGQAAPTPRAVVIRTGSGSDRSGRGSR